MKYVVPVLFTLLAIAALPAMAVGPAIAGAPGTADLGGDTVDASDEIAGGTAESTTHPIQADNTSNRLAVDQPVRSEYDKPGADLTVALESADDELRLDHQLYVLDRAFDDATNDERAELVETTYERVTDRIETLETRERDVVRAHAGGEISNTELMQTLVRNHVEAGELQSALLELEDRADMVSGYSLDTRSDRTLLDTYQGDVRLSAEASNFGFLPGSTSDLVSIKTGESGYVLSTVEDDNYVREATRFDNRDPDATSREFQSPSDAWDRAIELYPWVTERTGSASVNERTAANLFWIQAPHADGDFDAYLDGATGDVFREEQRLSTGSLPIAANSTWTSDSIELAVNETPANGPIEVTTTDPTTGDPVEATISIGDVELGETGADGTMWLVPPADDEYELTAERGADSVNATLPAE